MIRRSAVAHTLAGLALSLGASGCMDELDKGSSILDTRVIGVRVEVVGNESVAAPSPGELARLTVLLAEPPGDDQEPLGWGIGLGPLVQQGTGRPIVLELPVPDAALLGGARSFPLVGQICANGTPRFGMGETPPTCSEGATRATSFLATISLAREGVPPNRHPVLADDFATLAEERWESPAAALPATGCASLAGGPTLPLVPVSKTAQRLLLRVADTERESFVRTDGSEGKEIITLSQFTSGGDLARQFSVFEGDVAPDAEVEWTPDLAADPGGTLVRFWFVARDGRGGVASTTRAVCVVP